MSVVDDFETTGDQMLIIQKYERFLNYVYPIVMSIPRGHMTLKNIIVESLHKVPALVYQATKSDNVAKLYLVDAGLAEVRFYLRRMVFARFLTSRQLIYVQELLTEVGKILGSWIKNKKNSSRSGKESAVKAAVAW